MLSKLLKYDLKWIYKGLITFYGLGILFAGLTRLFGLINDSTAFSFISGMCGFITVLILISIIIYSFLRLWSRLIKNMYGDESYLTHTLPVLRKNTYLSKFISAFITMISSVGVIAISIFIAFYSSDIIANIKGFINMTFTNFDGSGGVLLFILGLTMFLELIFIVLIGYSGIIIGHKFNNGKISKSVLFGIVIYFMIQSISLVATIIFGLFNQDMMNLFTSSDNVSFSIIKSSTIFSVILYAVYIIGLYITDKLFLKKGVNVN